ncbi:MAG: hypothetical protein ABJH63_02170 [Rhizobiaceae bacterium]
MISLKQPMCWGVLSLGLLTFPLQSSAEIIKQYKAGFWVGGAETSQSGKIFNCFMRAKHQRDGYSIYFRWDGSGFHLTLLDSSWALSSGAEFTTTVRIDKRFSQQLNGSVLGTTVVDYPFGFNEDAWEAFKAGSKVSFGGPVGDKSFPLVGTSKAIDKLFECASEYYPDNWLEDQVADFEAPVPAPALAPAATATKAPSKSSQLPGADATQHALGIMAGDIEGTPEEAFALVETQAEVGDREALWMAGRMGLAGFGTQPNRAMAFARILAAAEEGHPEALTFLALHYLAEDDPIKKIVGRDYLNRAVAQAHGPAIAARQLLEEEGGL